MKLKVLEACQCATARQNYSPLAFLLSEKLWRWKKKGKKQANKQSTGTGCEKPLDQLLWRKKKNLYFNITKHGNIAKTHCILSLINPPQSVQTPRVEVRVSYVACKTLPIARQKQHFSLVTFLGSEQTPFVQPHCIYTSPSHAKHVPWKSGRARSRCMHAHCASPEEKNVPNSLLPASKVLQLLQVRATFQVLVMSWGD